MRGGGGGGGGSGGHYCMLHFVFIWSEKFYFYQGQLKEFCTLISVVTMYKFKFAYLCICDMK